MSNKHNLGTSNDVQTNSRAAFDTRQSSLPSILFSMGGVEATATDDTQSTETSTGQCCFPWGIEPRERLVAGGCCKKVNCENCYTTFKLLKRKHHEQN